MRISTADPSLSLSTLLPVTRRDPADARMDAGIDQVWSRRRRRNSAEVGSDFDKAVRRRERTQRPCSAGVFLGHSCRTTTKALLNLCSDEQRC